MSRPIDLTRFVDAQESTYQTAVRELQEGKKRGHWMWYVFPQIAGLGTSVTSRTYAIKSIDEARAYHAHPVLGPRLTECTRLVCNVGGRTAEEIFGHVDGLKFRSCMTLFDRASGESLFRDALDKFYAGRPDQQTLDILDAADE